MDKQTLMLILEECFKEEGNYAVLHFVDSSELLVVGKPSFFNLHLTVNVEYIVNTENVVEKYCIPYSSILYITLTNQENLDIIAKQNEPLRENKDVFFYDKLTEDIE